MDNPAALGIRFGARSEIGPRRPNNQDSGFASEKVLLIADGVGGAPAGELASALVVRTLAGALSDPAGLDEAELYERVVLTNAQLSRAGRRNPRLRGMATTMTSLILTDRGGFIAHIGDSRAYRWRSGQLTQITIDQSWIQLLQAERPMTPDQIKRHPMRNLLLHSLSGALADPDALHLLPVDVLPGDRWLLTTDGLSSYLPMEIFENLVRNIEDPQNLADQLVDQAWPRSRDNISVVVGDICTGSSPADAVFIGAADEPAAYRQAL